MVIVIGCIVLMILGVILGMFFQAEIDSQSWVITEEEGVLHIRFANDEIERQCRSGKIKQITDPSMYIVIYFQYLILKNKDKLEK